jgi:hypothetical protein
LNGKLLNDQLKQLKNNEEIEKPREAIEERYVEESIKGIEEQLFEASTEGIDEQLVGESMKELNNN